MEIIDIFKSFAVDFELAVLDNDFSRLERYLADDATYLNVGGPDPKCVGRAEIIAFLKADVTSTDKRFDRRKLEGLTLPTVDGDRLSRRWRTTYKLAGTPDLVVEGEARYLFEGALIKEIEEEPDGASIERFNDWMEKYRERLNLF